MSSNIAVKLSVEESGVLVECLGAQGWEARHNAFECLAQQGTAVIEALIEGTANQNWRVRRGCADLMDHLADSRCVEPLLLLLNDPITAVRRLALHALSCQGCKVCPLQVDIVGNLSRLALEDSSIQVRRVAIHQLGCQPPDPRAVETLKSIIAHESDAKLLSRAQWAISQHQKVQ